MTDVPLEEPPADPRDALIGAQAERIGALEAVVADLRERLEAAERSGSRNSGNSSMPPSSDDLPGRKPPRRQRHAAERAEKKRRGKQPGSPGASMAWEVPDRTEDHYPGGACSCGADLADAEDLGVTRSFQQEEIPAAAAERVQHDLHNGEMRLREDARRAAPGRRAGFRAVDRAAAAGPGGVPGGFPACPGGAVPAADRGRDRRSRVGRVHPLMPGEGGVSGRRRWWR